METPMTNIKYKVVFKSNNGISGEQEFSNEDTACKFALIWDDSIVYETVTNTRVIATNTRNVRDYLQNS